MSTQNNVATVPLQITAETRADKLREVMDQLERGVKDFFSTDRYRALLRAMSCFHNYSINNTMLIVQQRPDATFVAGYATWKNKFGRSVNKGERGIRIIAPVPMKIKEETNLIDPDTGEFLLDENGEKITKEIDRVIPAFKLVSVFDISQTSGKDIPGLDAPELHEGVENYDEMFAALEKASPVPISFENINGGASGYYSHATKSIAIKNGMAQSQTIKTTIHEIAHSMLHEIKDSRDISDLPDKNTREVQAESVAYVVCSHYGIDVSEYSFEYIAGWSSGRDAKELMASLETIQDAASEIISRVDKELEGKSLSREDRSER